LEFFAPKHSLSGEERIFNFQEWRGINVIVGRDMQSLVLITTARYSPDLSDIPSSSHIIPSASDLHFSPIARTLYSYFNPYPFTKLVSKLFTYSVDFSASFFPSHTPPPKKKKTPCKEIPLLSYGSLFFRLIRTQPEMSWNIIRGCIQKFAENILFTTINTR
jgi:hypothetical protein